MADTLLLKALATQNNPCRASMYLAASTAVLSAGLLPFDTISYDPSGSCTTGVGAKFTCPADGYYRVAAQSSTMTSGAWGIALFKNGGDVAFGNWQAAAIAARSTSVVNAEIKCAAGDVLQISNQGSGTVTTIASGGAESFFNVEWTGPA